MICPYCGKEIDETGLSDVNARNDGQEKGYLPLHGEYTIPAVSGAATGVSPKEIKRKRKTLLIASIAIAIVAVLVVLVIVNWQSLASLFKNMG